MNRQNNQNSKLQHDDDCCTHILTIFFLLYLFSSRIIVNITQFDETVVQSERFSAIKPGLLQHFLHLKMPVPSQEYDSCCPFVFDVFFHVIRDLSFLI